MMEKPNSEDCQVQANIPKSISNHDDNFELSSGGLLTSTFENYVGDSENILPKDPQVNNKKLLPYYDASAEFKNGISTDLSIPLTEPTKIAFAPVETIISEPVNSYQTMEKKKTVVEPVNKTITFQNFLNEEYLQKSQKANDIKEQETCKNDNFPINLLPSEPEENAVELKITEKDSIEIEPEGKDNEKSLDENGLESSDIFSVDIPLIGKDFFPYSEEKPFLERYDLAIQMNKVRGIQSQKEVGSDSGLDFHERIRQKNSMSDAEKQVAQASKQLSDRKIAMAITKLGIDILKLLGSETFSEEAIENCFDHFLSMSLTANSLLYVPHFVHTIMFCRGESELLSHELRMKADHCVQRCQCLFPVPVGYNFETVYTAQVRKFSLSPEFVKLDDIPLEYEDLSDIDSDALEPDSALGSSHANSDEEGSCGVRSRYE